MEGLVQLKKTLSLNELSFHSCLVFHVSVVGNMYCVVFEVVCYMEVRHG